MYGARKWTTDPTDYTDYADRKSQKINVTCANLWLPFQFWLGQVRLACSLSRLILNISITKGEEVTEGAVASDDKEPGATEGAVTSDDKEPVVMYCTNHPDRVTYLRCNKCGRPMCTDCLVLTDVGYRCHDCIRDQQSRFFNAGLSNVGLAVLISFAEGVLLILVGLLVVLFIGFWGLLLAPALAGLAADGTWRAASRQRARRLRIYTTVALIGGALAGGAIVVLFIPIGLWGFLFFVIGVFTFYNRVP